MLGIGASGCNLKKFRISREGDRLSTGNPVDQNIKKCRNCKRILNKPILKILVLQNNLGLLLAAAAMRKTTSHLKNSRLRSRTPLACGGLLSVKCIFEIACILVRLILLARPSPKWPAVP